MSSLSEFLLDDDEAPAPGESFTSSLVAAAASGSHDGGGSSLSFNDNESNSGSIDTNVNLTDTMYGNSVMMIKSTAEVCCGSIGTGPVFHKFCGMLKKECTVAKHERLKVTVTEGFYMLEPNNKGRFVCLLHPTLPLNSVTSEEAEVLLNLDEPLDKVEERFNQTLNRKKSGISFESVDKESKSVIVSKTPVKSNTKSQQDTLDFSNLTSGYLARNLSFDQNTILGLKKGLDAGALSDVVNILVQNSMELPQFLIDFTNTADTLATVVQDKIADVKALALMLNNIKQEVGYPSASKPAKMPGSVWESLKWLSDLVIDANLKLSQLEAQGNVRDKENQDLAKDLRTVLSSFRVRLVKLTDKIKALEALTSATSQGHSSGLGNLQLAPSPTNASQRVSGVNRTDLNGFHLEKNRHAL